MKKAFIKRALLTMTAMVMTTSMVACGTKNKSDEAAKTNANATKPTVITAIMDAGMLDVQSGQQQFLDEYKKQTGVELKVTQPSHNQYYEKVNLAFASNDIPDVVEINGSTMVNYASNGALYDATNLVKNSDVFKKMDQKYIDSVKVNGKIYGVPIAMGNGPITYMRKDWLDKNNLKVPTTYDEFTNVLKVFANDPDKNGKKDTIAYTAPGLISTDPTATDNYVREFYQDAKPDFIKKNGKWVDGMQEPEMKQALQRMKDAYNQGLLDKEIVTNKTSTCRDKWNSGQVGVFTYWAGTWNVSLEDTLKKTVPDAQVVAIPAIKGTKYEIGVPNTYCITSKCKNPEGVFKYLFEYMHDGDKGTLLWAHGVEGVHYKVDNGKYTPLPSLKDPKVLQTKALMEIGCNLEPNYKDPITPDSRITESMKLLKANSITTSLLPASDNYNKNSADLLTIKSNIISKVVIDKMSVDDGITEYKKQAKALVDPILQDFNASK